MSGALKAAWGLTTFVTVGWIAAAPKEGPTP